MFYSTHELVVGWHLQSAYCVSDTREEKIILFCLFKHGAENQWDKSTTLQLRDQNIYNKARWGRKLGLEQ